MERHGEPLISPDTNSSLPGWVKDDQIVSITVNSLNRIEVELQLDSAVDTESLILRPARSWREN